LPAGRVYSTQLCALQGVTENIPFTADAGFITVLRCFDAYWGGGLPILSSVRLIGSSGQTIFEAHPLSDGTTTPIDSHHWQWKGRQIIFGGETWAVEAAGGAADISVSGYLLTDLPAGP
jgi:hypothetical protein